MDTWLQAIELLRDTSHVRSRARLEWEAAIIRAGLIPGIVRPFRVRLNFAVWIERMRTLPIQADAIRALQAVAPDGVTRHLKIDADGSFSIHVALFVAAKPMG